MQHVQENLPLPRLQGVPRPQEEPLQPPPGQQASLEVETGRICCQLLNVRPTDLTSLPIEIMYVHISLIIMCL